ncbi:MAG: sulfur carrier protein ThiS adenylyltransferase ThiF [Oscillospiraceae bacterium]|nr:sulfur carrier protein ThiS adenylyltransferase ThiF [Oscillospiraceae bacterium]
MRVTLNGAETETSACTAFDLRTGDEGAIVILNGYQITSDRVLNEGDQVCIIKKGTMPDRGELEAMMAARHTPGVHERMKSGRVAIAGLGGLGSHVAVFLARMGVGELLLVDFDIVEPSNLNRQHYMIAHLSMPKTQALKSQIMGINPYIRVMTRDVRVTAGNAASVFAGWPIVVEAFDDPAAKAELVEALLAGGGTKIVAASGLAGLGDANDIQTRNRLSNLYICGDLESEAGEGTGLMAPRVAVCAGHQANMAVRLLMGLE